MGGLLNLSLSNFFDFLKQKPSIWFAIALATGFLVFASPPAAREIGLKGFRDDYRPIIGALFLLSSVLWAVNVLGRIGASSLQGVGRLVAYWKQGRVLKNLSPPERALLRRFYESQTKTRRLKLPDGIVSGLSLSGVLYQASELVERVPNGLLAEVNLSEWAWKRIRRQPGLIEAVPPRSRSPRESRE